MFINSASLVILLLALASADWYTLESYEVFQNDTGRIYRDRATLLDMMTYDIEQ